MNIKKKVVSGNYQDFVKVNIPGTNLFTDCLRAFVSGGIICVIGQGFSVLGERVLGLSQDLNPGFTSIVMIFLGALLTGFGIYDVIGRFALAGSILPITGYANSIVSSAMEFKHEGYVLGVGAKLFTIAGPVLVYGITASVTVGLVYFFMKVAGGF